MEPLEALRAAPVSRRHVLRGSGIAAAAVALTSFTPAQAHAAVAEKTKAGRFGFGVASGDPTATEVLLWTRVTPDASAVPGSGRGRSVPVRWEVAADEHFDRVLQRGIVLSDVGSDHTIKVVVRGLEPYTRYWYRFRSGGQVSPVGRTQTSPDEPGRTHALRLAFVSCSNYTGGFFTAYRGLAARRDLDFVLHLGDYVYEYGNTRRVAGVPGSGDRYGPAGLVGVRDHQPAEEMLSLSDYRVRHALYKTDADLAAAHQRHPWVVIFDDHEIANDSYDTGAENHEPADDTDTPYTGPGEPPGIKPEGDFLARKAVALRAYREWMPIREPETWQPERHAGQQFFRRFTFGTLAQLSVIDTRQNRDKQVPAVVDGALNPALEDAGRELPDRAQRRWLIDGLTNERSLWHLVGNQTVFTRVFAIPQNSPLPGQVFNTDQWDGYQADQAAVLRAMRRSGQTDAVVLTGDIHSSWANDLPTDYDRYRENGRSSVGVEFVCPSITSDGFKEVLGGSAATATAVTGFFRAANPWVKYLDGIGHGFVVLDVTHERVQADYWFIRTGGDKGLAVDPRLDPDATVGFEAAWRSVKGSHQVSPSQGPLGPRLDEPREWARGRGRGREAAELADARV